MAVKVYVVYYSMYGHTEELAKELARGSNSVIGVEATLWQVPETLSTEELQNLGAPPKSDVPIITPNQLSEADGIIFVFRTIEVPQLIAFLDAVENQHIIGKPTTIVTSRSIQTGEYEIPSDTIPKLNDQGMIYVLLTLGIESQNNSDPVVENITRSPTFELLVAFQNGSRFAGITKKFKEDSA